MWTSHFHSQQVVSWLYNGRAVFLFNEWYNSELYMYIHVQEKDNYTLRLDAKLTWKWEELVWYRISGEHSKASVINYFDIQNYVELFGDKPIKLSQGVFDILRSLHQCIQKVIFLFRFSHWMLGMVISCTILQNLLLCYEMQGTILAVQIVLMKYM